MRDVGFLIWIVLLFVGVLGSITSSIRKQAQRAGAQPTSRPAPLQLGAQGPAPARREAAPRRVPVQAPKPAAPKTALVTAPLSSDHPVPVPRRLFRGHSDLVRAVIAAEVLGKPRGLADEYPFR